MKSLRFAALLALILAPAISLAQSGTVISVMAQKQKLSISQQGSGFYSGVDSSDTLETDTGLGIGVGIGGMDGRSRFLLEFSGLSAEDAADINFYVAGWEGFFPLSAAPAVRPFVGVSAGLGKFDLKSGYASGTRGDSDSRFIYGASAGVQFALDKQVALELRARYLQTDLQVRAATALPTNYIDISVDNAVSYSAGLSWQF